MSVCPRLGLCHRVSVCLLRWAFLGRQLHSLSPGRRQAISPQASSPPPPAWSPTFLSPPWLLAVGTYCLG